MIAVSVTTGVICTIQLALSTVVAAQPNVGVSISPVEAIDRGVLIHEIGATKGFTLFAPMNGQTTYLIDMDGAVVRSWVSEFTPSGWAHITDEGFLLRGGKQRDSFGFSAGGQGGRIEKFAPDGELIWSYSLNTQVLMPHHDAAILPNGNILALVWEAKDKDAALAAGRHPDSIPEDGIWSDGLVELDLDDNGPRIVWEWRVWDHLNQGIDARLRNFASPAEHPDRVDINGDHADSAVALSGLSADVFHLNSVDYNEYLDQVLLSSPTFNEIWIIDHSTTTEEASGSDGGRYGVGGDILYRWGNPQAYGRGRSSDRQIGFQHDAHWVPRGYPGAGNILLFSNRSPTANGDVSKVIEIVAPVSPQGGYQLEGELPFGPHMPIWGHSDSQCLNATHLSGAQRLSTGNTLITCGPRGELIEIDASGHVVWLYRSPFPEPDGLSRGGGATRGTFAIFRATRIPVGHPALAALNL